MSNYNNGRNNNDRHGGGGGGHTKKSARGKKWSSGSRKDHGGNERNFTKFADNDHVNKEPDYWPQNDWNYNDNHYNNSNYKNHKSYHGSNSNNFSNSGGHSGGVGGGIFPWQRNNPINPLIIPPQVCPNLPKIKNLIFNDEDAEMPSMHDTASQNNILQPSTPQRIQFENQNDAKSTPRSRQNSTSAKSSESRSLNNLTSVNNPKTDETAVDKNIESNSASVTKHVPEVATNFTVKIKQEKRDLNKLKQERKSSSSSSSSSEESTSSDEEPEKAKKTGTLKTPVVKPTTTITPAPSGNSTPLNIKLKPQQKPAVQVKSSTSTSKTNVIKNPTTSSSSSSDDEEQPPPPQQVIKTKAKPVIKQEAKVKSSKKKNSSEDDVVCLGQLENKFILDDDDEEDEKDSDSLDESSTSKKATTTKLKKSAKKTIETCMICDKKGHTSFQCQMICKNCSAPYHGFRTCPQPGNLNIMLQLFMEFCMQQIQHYNPEKQFTTQTATTGGSHDTVSKPQVGSPSTMNTTKTNNKLKRKQATAKETKTKVKPRKKIKLSNIKKRMSENDDDDDDDDDSDNSSANEENSTNSEDSSSSAETLVSANTKRKSKNAKSKNNSMNAFNLANFIPNPNNLPLVLNGFPNLTAPPTNVTNPNTSTNALNTLLLTQMFQNAIGSLK